MSLNWTNVKSLAIPVNGTARDVKRVSIGGVTVWEKPSPLPYDAEVEYLESTGTQWIETGIIPDANIGLQLFSSSPVNTNDAYIAGERNDTSNTRWVIGWSSGVAKWYCGYGVTITSQVDGSPILTSINYLGDGLFKVGNSYSYTLPSLSYSPAYNIRLFGSAGVTAAYTSAAVKIYSAKISEGDTLVRDYIPVRKGTVGYLYDRVSGKLFGNEGSGAFGYGQDVVHVEYLESHGTEWIDTGLLMGINNYLAGVDAEIDASFSSTPNVGQAIFKNKTCYFFLGVNASGKYYSGMRKEYAASNISNDGARHTFNLSSATNSFSIDGNVVTQHSDQNPTADWPSNILLFAVSNQFDSPSYYASMRCYGCDFRYSNSPVRKFAPVRVGTDATSWEGAMMDTLTRRIYRNAGTGAFTYGADLPYPIGGN